MKKINRLERLKIKAHNLEIRLASKSLGYRQFNRMAKQHFLLICFIDSAGKGGE